MITYRWAIAVVLLGGVLLWLAFGEQKSIALGVSIPIVLICRWLMAQETEATCEPKNEKGPET